MGDSRLRDGFEAQAKAMREFGYPDDLREAPGMTTSPTLLSSVLASNRPRLMAYALAIAAVTAPIMTPTPRKK